MILQKLVNKKKKNKGQAMTEYVIIICLVAVAALLVVGVFGTNIRRLFASADASLAGGVATQSSLSTQGDAQMQGSVRVNKFTGDK